MAMNLFFSDDMSEMPAAETAEGRAVRALAAKDDADFAGAGANPGLEIWRIASFSAGQIPEAEHGAFYAGDAYLVLSTTDKGHDLHMWLGKDSTADEKGTAAILSIQLAESLPSPPTMHREPHAHESALFLSYFPELRILAGGMDSGFASAEDTTYPSRLLHVHGKSPVRVEEIAMVSAAMRLGDVYILDLGKKVWQWNSPGCSPFERAKAAGVFECIEAARLGKVETVVLDGDDAYDDQEFWEPLGGVNRNLPPAVPDEAAEPLEAVNKLFKIDDDDSDGILEVLEVEGATELPADAGDSIFILVRDRETVAMKVGMECNMAERYLVLNAIEKLLEAVGASTFANVESVK